MSEHLERLRLALPARYDLDRELGRGGMAVVFLATDAHNKRRVAIKRTTGPHYSISIAPSWFRSVALGEVKRPTRCAATWCFS